MNRPSPGDLTATLHPEERERTGPSSRGSTTHRARGLARRGCRAATTLRPALGRGRAWQELEWSLAPDAYWRQATWRRLTAIFAGPAVNLLFAVVLFTSLFLIASERNTNVIGTRRGGQPGRVGPPPEGRRNPARRRPASRSRRTSRPTSARPRASRSSIVVRRHGNRVVIGPLRAKQDHGAYRIGIAIEARTGPGESLPRRPATPCG